MRLRYREARRRAPFPGLSPLVAFFVGCASRPVASPRAEATHSNDSAGVSESKQDEARPLPGAPPEPATEEPGAGRPCGEFECRLFDSPNDAFSRVLQSSPRVLGVGEAHALAGTEKTEPAARRFARDFLPLLSGRASDIVVELLIPNPKCKKATEQAKGQQKVVTERQASTDQNDYVALAERARALGIRAHALEPTCDDLRRIAGAGPDAVTVSLDVVTRLSREALERLYQRNVAENDARLVVAYGGLMHNDSSPRPGREQWSFGPALQKLTGDCYVDVDLVVPEFISDSPAWQSLPWTHIFDPNAHPEAATLLSPGKGSFVLVFPRSKVD
jgi:hypothetical protein